MTFHARPPLVLTDAQFEDMTRRGAFEKVGRVELRGGVLTPMSPVHLKHASAVRALTVVLTDALGAGALAFDVLNEITIRFGGGFQPTADIVLWDPAAVPTGYDGPLPAGAAKLVVEISDSTLADDLGDKALEYAQGGLQEYWVADVRSRTVFLHADPSEAGFARRATAPFGAAVQALTLPLTVDTAAL